MREERGIISVDCIATRYQAHIISAPNPRYPLYIYFEPSVLSYRKKHTWYSPGAAGRRIHAAGGQATPLGAVCSPVHRCYFCGSSYSQLDYHSLDTTDMIETRSYACHYMTSRCIFNELQLRINGFNTYG